MHSPEPPSPFATVQRWAYRGFLAGQAGLLIGLFLFPLLTPVLALDALWVWLADVLPWSPTFGSPPSGVPPWVGLWGASALGLFLAGVALSGWAAAVELRRVDPRAGSLPGQVAWPAPRLSGSSYRTLRAIRRWLLIEGALAYAVGVYSMFTESYGRYYDPWPLMSIFLFTGIFLFSLALVPSYFLSVDDLRSGGWARRRRELSIWTQFNTP